MLLNAFNISSTNFTFYSYPYKTNASSARLTFAFRHDVDIWFLDDVSVSNGTWNVLGNGDFELGSTGWTSCTQGGTNSGGDIAGGGGSYFPHSGSQCYMNEISNDIEYLSQTFSTIPNVQYAISFWLRSSALANYPGAVVSAQVFVTP